MRVIKTAIEFSTYSEDQPVVLLGDWCLKDLGNILSSRGEIERIPYHWDDRKKYNDDYIYLTDLYEKTLISLVLSQKCCHCCFFWLPLI